MGVRENMSHRMQSFEVYVVGDGSFLAVVEGAAIDDDGFAAIIADDVAVLAEWVNGKGFAINHGLIKWRIDNGELTMEN